MDHVKSWMKKTTLEIELLEGPKGKWPQLTVKSCPRKLKHGFAISVCKN